MATMASNHLITNIYGRLQNYLKWRYPEFKSFHKQILYYIIDAPTAEINLKPYVPKPKTPKPIDIKKKTKESIQKEKKKKENNERHIALKKQFFEYEVGFVKSIIEKLRLIGGDDGIRKKPQYSTNASSSLPLYRHMLLDTEYERVKNPKTKGKVFNILPTKNGFTIANIGISKMAFLAILKAHSWEFFTGDGRDLDARSYWEYYFNLKSFETANRRFGESFMTDGYAISAIVDKTCPFITSSDDREDFETKRHIARLLRKKDQSKVEKVAVDPGFSSVATVARASDDVIQSYSSSKYYEKSKVTMSNRRTNKWNKGTEDDVKSISSGKTADIEKLSTHIEEYLLNYRTILEHRARKGYRNMRFLRYIHKKKAITEICDMIAPPKKTVIVGFGDWNGGRGTPISRRCAGPIQEIKLELKNRDNVLFQSINEKKTSITCFNCNCRLSNMIVKKEIIKDGSVKTVNSKVHKVLHCKNNQSDSDNSRRCGTTWNRDDNAAQNLLMLLMRQINGLPRPEVFT
jgi:hypothetical protein